MGIFKKKNIKGLRTDSIMLICTAAGAAAGLVIGGFDKQGIDFYFPPMLGGMIGLVLSAIVCTSIENAKSRKARKERERRLEQERAAMDTDRLDSIIEYIKEHSARPVYRITTHASDGAALTDSKYGGFPFWPEGMDYPETENGEKLLLLAQINLSDCTDRDGELPQRGILQFFTADDDLTGCCFEDNTRQDGFRVVYHEDISRPLSIDRLREMGIPANTELDRKLSCFPFFNEYKLSFEKGTDYMSECVTGFDELVAEALRELYGEEMEGSGWKYFNETDWEYITKPFSTWGDKLSGYPAFVQEDPRYYAGETDAAEGVTTAHYDHLLFQIDSGGEIMWGDCGVANFFINSEALKNLDFSDIYYTWDCG